MCVTIAQPTAVLRLRNGYAHLSYNGRSPRVAFGRYACGGRSALRHSRCASGEVLLHPDRLRRSHDTSHSRIAVPGARTHAASNRASGKPPLGPRTTYQAAGKPHCRRHKVDKILHRRLCVELLAVENGPLVARAVDTPNDSLKHRNLWPRSGDEGNAPAATQGLRGRAAVWRLHGGS